MSSNLREELKDKEYRDAFVAAYVRNGIAFQIRAMRESRGWDQKKLADKMGNVKLQPIVSRYENPDYGRFSMTTLLDLAKAFDVGLIVRFAPFSELIDRDDDFADESLDVDSYAREVLAYQPLPQVMPTVGFAKFEYLSKFSEAMELLNLKVAGAGYVATQGNILSYGMVSTVDPPLPIAYEPFTPQTINRYEGDQAHAQKH
jgi:transcriptional regulator with XRE-family HTH domain